MDKLKQMISEMANDLRPEITKIESMPETTQHHYGFYMNVIGRNSKNKAEGQVIALALMEAGANVTGVKNALKLIYQ